MQSVTPGRDQHRVHLRRRRADAACIACGLTILLTTLTGCRIVVGRPGAVRADGVTPAAMPVAGTAPMAPPTTVAVSTPLWNYQTLPSPTPSATPTTTPTATSTPTPEPVTYVVREGDSLSRIAEAFGLTVVEIMAANDLGDPNAIRVGEQLVIPGVAATPTMDPLSDAIGGGATPEPTAAPTATVEPSKTPIATPSPYPTYTPYPTHTPYPTLTPWPTYTPYPTYTPWTTPVPPAAPSGGTSAGGQAPAQPTQQPYVAPTYTPYPTYTPFPSATPTHTRTATPRPTDTTYPTYTPQPTYTPYPTFTPVVPVKGPKPPGT